MANPWDNDPIFNASPRGGTILNDPYKQAEQAREAERLRIAQQAAQASAAKEVRDAREWQGTHNADGSPKTAPNDGAGSAKVRADAIGQWNAAMEIDRILADMRGAYAKGPGATKGIRGIQDFFDTPANQSFDTAANQSRGIVRNALGLTGGEANTATEANMNLGGYLPQSSDWDGTIVDKFTRLEGLRDNARRQAIQTLGGIPDANGNITPIPAHNAMQQTFLTHGAGPQAAGNNATMGSTPIPKEMQSEFDAYVAQNLGNLDPDAYAKFRMDLDRKYGFPDAGQEGTYREEGARLRKVGPNGGRTINTRIPAPERKLSVMEQQRNNLVSNPEMAAVVGAANMGGFGIPEMLAPEQMAAIGEAYPTSTALGQVVGSVGGTGLVGKVGAAAARRLAPRLLGGGAKAQVARNLATDATYSGIYGGNTQDDPLGSAAWGAGGSLAGQGVGRVLGAAVGGVVTSPAVQALRARGIPLTVGQTLGGAPKALEDAGTSIPGIGDIINARRLSGLRRFNQEALNEAGAPIGAKVSEGGELGVQSLIDQISNSYDDATRGVNVLLDPQFSSEIAASRAMGRQLPPDLSSKFSMALDNRVAPIENAGAMTGDTYQQSVRGLKGYKAEHSKPGFEEDYRNALNNAIDVLTGQMQRGGGAKTAAGLGRSNEAYKRAKVVQRAVQAAKNGTGSGEIQVFTPAQLNTASQQAANKFGGQRVMAPLIDAGQSTLPSKIPDSGTARRALTAALPTLGGAGIGAGAGYFSGDTKDGVAKGIALGTLLAIGGTKQGQAVLTKLLADRPAVARKLGGVIRKHKGLLGSAAIPFALEGGD